MAIRLNIFAEGTKAIGITVATTGYMNERL